MTMKHGFRNGRSARGVPVSRRFLRNAGSLVFLALIGVTQTGCQSGFFGPCGGCNSLKNWRPRIFHRSERTVYGGSYGGAVTGGTVVGPAVTSEVPMDSGTTTILSPAPSSVGVGPALPAPAESSSTTPLPQSQSQPQPQQIEPIPSATPGPASDAGPSTGAKATTGKVNYEATRPRPRSRTAGAGNNSLSRTIIKTPGPTLRSAQGPLPAPGLVDDLPTLDVPRAPARTELSRSAAPAIAPKPVAPLDPSANTASTIPAPEGPAPDEIHVAPIRRFTRLDGRLSGGALPTAEGLDWLAEKGYRTILDLREPSEVQAAFMNQVTSRGLRYLSIPISVKTVDTDHLSRFAFELSMPDARPLYFFDTDGTRAGVLWYVRRLTVDRVDALEATREAEELGLSKTNTEFWAAAQAYLDRLNTGKPPRAAEAQEAPRTVAPELAPISTSDRVPATGPTATGKPEAAILARFDALSVMAPLKDAPEPAVLPRDPTAWRPYLAMLLTVLGVPLAYLGRTGFASRRAARKASLPGPGRRPRSLPAASGG